MLDPDRFFNHPGPGSHEWWYFDAISDDGRDALVLVWYAGLPFDPSYGVATLRHLRDPGKFPAPKALDHSAIGFSWYRDGKTMAYALNGYKSDRFRLQAEPFSVEIGSSRVDRDDHGYRLNIKTPSVEGRPIVADLRFEPAGSTEPFERDLGSPGAPHHWVLAVADCRVSGEVAIGDKSLTFRGRGYHDHNAGAEEMSVAMKRWEWGRVHHGDRTDIYYMSEPQRGPAQSLRLTCRDGKPEVVEEGVASSTGPNRSNVFGIRHQSDLIVGDMGRVCEKCLDDGPFYRRWLAYFIPGDFKGINPPQGIAEVLDTRNLNSRWFNWMIPYRLKWPKS